MRVNSTTLCVFHPWMETHKAVDFAKLSTALGWIDRITVHALVNVVENLTHSSGRIFRVKRTRYNGSSIIDCVYKVTLSTHRDEFRNELVSKNDV